MIALAIAALAWVLALALRFALSRNREFLADAGAVELTRDPDAMIGALRRISGHSDLPRLPAQLQAMLLDSPAEALGSQLLATHPPLEERIAALVRYAGGRDPGPVVEAPPGPESEPEGQAADEGEAAPEAAPGAVPPPANPWGAAPLPTPATPWWRR
jgi:heat shock protein HtpX